MDDKRYSIFISSTFEDLRDERGAVQDAIISAGDFPVQMESFPATDQDQFEFIQKLIDDCDYYVLIIAGRYGAPTDDGMSYTEKEYHYAVSKGIPVLAMIHDNRGDLPLKKSESTPEGRERLAQFISKVETGRLRKGWQTDGDLKLAVREALEHAKRTSPGIGWVRGDAVVAKDTLAELNDARKEIERLRDNLGDVAIAHDLPTLPTPDEILTIELLSSNEAKHLSFPVRVDIIQTTWADMFVVACDGVNWYNTHYSGLDLDAVCNEIGLALIPYVTTNSPSRFAWIRKHTLHRLIDYYIEIGWMDASPYGSQSELGSRVARRHRIAGRPASAFKLISSTMEDDEIPF